MKQRDGTEENPYTIKQMQELLDTLKDPYDGPPIFWGKWGRKEAVLVAPKWYEQMKSLQKDFAKAQSTLGKTDAKV